MNGIEHDMSYNPRIIQAHTGELAAIALNPVGSLLATASKRVREFEWNGSGKKKDGGFYILGNFDSCLFHCWFM